jgi:hypothetical protein
MSNALGDATPRRRARHGRTKPKLGNPVGTTLLWMAQVECCRMPSLVRTHMRLVHEIAVSPCKVAERDGCSQLDGRKP